MKIRLVVALVGLAMSIALPTFAQQQSTVDPEVRQGIDAVFMKFGEAFNKRDPVAMAALFTQDAVQLWPWSSEDAVASGQQAIEKRFAVLLSSPGEFVGQVVGVYPIGNDMSVLTKGSVGTLWTGYRAWICVHDADTWKIRMEYAN
jgi:uncharacterized protein (TIGR02246 family)